LKCNSLKHILNKKRIGTLRGRMKLYLKIYISNYRWLKSILENLHLEIGSIILIGPINLWPIGQTLN